MNVLAKQFESTFFRRAATQWDFENVGPDSGSADRLNEVAARLGLEPQSDPVTGGMLRSRDRLRADLGAIKSALVRLSADSREGTPLEPAASRFLDNFHLVEETINATLEELEALRDNRLPAVLSGQLAGYPFVLRVLLTYVSNADGRLDPELLKHFLRAYQERRTLAIGEVRAIATMFRFAILARLRDVCDRLAHDADARRLGDGAADLLLGAGARAAMVRDGEITTNAVELAQIVKRLRNLDADQPEVTAWLAQNLSAKGKSADELVHEAHVRQGASNVTMRNLINAMREGSHFDWGTLSSELSAVDRGLRGASGFFLADMATRERYRLAIERLAARSPLSEVDVAFAAASAAGDALAQGGASDDVFARDVGPFLVGESLPAFQRLISYRPTIAERLTATLRLHALPFYAGAIFVTSAVLLTGLMLTQSGGGGGYALLISMALFGSFPAVEAANAFVNSAVALFARPRAIPGLELGDGLTPVMTTLVAVPNLLQSAGEIDETTANLEVLYLSNQDPLLTFAAVYDFVDSDAATLDDDSALEAHAHRAFETLNQKYPRANGGARFLFLLRARRYNAADATWMGWERKRGKLHELNRLLRGATDTSYRDPLGQSPSAPEGVRYVVTLDADTRVPRDAIRRLVGKMAHPLNRPLFDADKKRVVGGYALMQPRIAASFAEDGEDTVFHSLTALSPGLDIYAGAVSDAYQDLFGEGSFTGKGIYDVDAFECALAGRVPENLMLSHDLFEGTFARAGLATDVQFVEEFPSRYDVAAMREHRWARGDWQLVPWLWKRLTSPRSDLPWLGFWKMADNLRRALNAPAAIAALFVGWFAAPVAASSWTLGVVGALFLPQLLPIAVGELRSRRTQEVRGRWRALGVDVVMVGVRTALSVAMLADNAYRMLDAAARAWHRMCLSHRNLLEWTTAAQARSNSTLSIAHYARFTWRGAALGVSLCVVALTLSPHRTALPLVFGIIWALSPVWAFGISRPRASDSATLSKPQRKALRSIARETWRYFEEFVTADEKMLPPDNFQETPAPLVASRTSPTNIGLHLLACLSAYDFGWIGRQALIARLEASLNAIDSLERYRGHLYNWYDTRSGAVLQPAYVSTVDSGNLAAALIALANGCVEIAGRLAPEANAIEAVDDTVRLLERSLTGLPIESAAILPLRATMREIRAATVEDVPFESKFETLKGLCDRASALARDLPAKFGEVGADVGFWCRALVKTVGDHRADRRPGAQIAQRCRGLAARAREMAMKMEFDFLFNATRGLLSIGFDVRRNALDGGCYDLLMTEERLGMLFAIAKGDIPSYAWFRMGRRSVDTGVGFSLLSWSGSMFEYLMPALLLREPKGSLIANSNVAAVRRQQTYAGARGVPWGISESAFNARDWLRNYQYYAFGVPDLALKRGLVDELVIAPYATALASMIDARGACANFERLEAIGGRGRYGFYEAIDFTSDRLREGEVSATVRSFMAHHQGMALTALANVLNEGAMRARFHAEPIVKTTELLLMETAPRASTALREPRPADAPDAGDNAWAAKERSYKSVDNSPPQTHLLSNGAYAVMVTAAGGGYSRWRDIAVTRWREDATRDPWGSHVFVRDVTGGASAEADRKDYWSTTWLPSARKPEEYTVLFGEERAEFRRRDGALTTTTEIVVPSDLDGEVRRVTLFNASRIVREIELTSYSEIVLGGAAGDDAHQAFSKMFVETEYRDEPGAVLAHRRKRDPKEPSLWAAHFAVVEGRARTTPSFETDRLKFIGRGRWIGSPEAMDGSGALSNTVGAVLDPVFALRQRVLVAPGGSVRISYWTIVSDSEEDLVNKIALRRDPDAFDRAKLLAWTHSQVEQRHHEITSADAATFQRLASSLIYADSRLRPPPDVLSRSLGRQSELWRHGVSGDKPIVVVRIRDVEDIAIIGQLSKFVEFLAGKRVKSDLVVINDRTASYASDLQSAIEAICRRPRAWRPDSSKADDIFALRADHIGEEACARLCAAARVVLVAGRGELSQQLPQSTVSTYAPAQRRFQRRVTAAPAAPIDSSDEKLEFFNGYGGFAKDGREYVVRMPLGRPTPAPWINILANREFGGHVSAEGAGYSWSLNSRDNPISPWSNDPVSDESGEAIFLRDEDTGECWSPTPWPMREDGLYVARHGFGYSRFLYGGHGVSSELTCFTPQDAKAKILRLKLSNPGAKARRVRVTAYVDWSLGLSRGANAPFIATECDPSTRALFARNAWKEPFDRRMAFLDMSGAQSSWTGDRLEFLGRFGSLRDPAALRSGAELSKRSGAGLDPCGAMSTVISIPAAGERECVIFVGQAEDASAARSEVARLRALDMDATFSDLRRWWSDILDAVHVKTPNRAMDIQLNGWLLYQTVACRILARSAFYQASGAYGFRDQLQDHMALHLTRPDWTRAHLLRAAGRQFVEGDVQHWWLPDSGRGVRTKISDDRVWLVYCVADYVAASGDVAVLDESLPYLAGPELTDDEPDSFFAPNISEKTASLFDHCALALDQACSRIGSNGLPLMGGGDWNDGMNRVGAGGRGESVWLGWFLIRAIDAFAPYAGRRAPERLAAWRARRESVRASIEASQWDGAWYRRATYDDGGALGSRDSDECRIDSISQTWAVLSGAAQAERARQAMESHDRLLAFGDGPLLLFTPPFDKTAREPGYIKGYPAGLRENGGQYTHAATWAIFAHAALGDGAAAVATFDRLNPVNWALSETQTRVYAVEPYVTAGDVYSAPLHFGRGGWTWYSGSAAWLYRGGIEAILGMRREGDRLTISPEIPASWPGFEANVRIGATEIHIRVVNTAVENGKADDPSRPAHRAAASTTILLDGTHQTVDIHLA